MKILFLHLSDMHIKTKGAASELHISKMLDSLREMGHFDRMVMIFSGDIAFSGSEAEYAVGSGIITTIFREIKRKKIYKGLIDILCVPGNHDIAYGENPRKVAELQEVYKNYLYKSYLAEELGRQESFFKFSSKNRCFLTPALFDRKFLTYDGYKIEINMINSAVFSMRDDEDKAFHFIDQDSINTLNTPTGSDLVISIMHHAPDWYIDDQKNQLERALLCKSSFIFLGHEHLMGIKNNSYNDEAGAFIHAGGALCYDDDWSKSEFVVGVFDTESNKYMVHQNRWEEDQKQYESKIISEIVVKSKPSIEKRLMVCDSYIKEIKTEHACAIADSFEKYFVFPRIETDDYDGDNKKTFLDTQSFMFEIEEKKKVLLVGTNGCGKTTLLKHLFIEFSKDKCVIMCDIDTIKKKESAKIVKTNFEDIYGMDYSDYVRFTQLPPEKKVLIIDDIDQIKTQDFEAYISSLSSEFGYMIFATKNVIDLNIVERMKKALDLEDSITKYKIMPFFADKREELIKKSVILKQEKDSSIDVDRTTEIICESVKQQKRFVSLTPEFIVNFVEYYCNNIGTMSNSDSTVFSKVFEMNITNALHSSKKNGLTVDKLFRLLSKLAYYAHFEKKYIFTDNDILSVLNAYKEYTDEEISLISFVETITDSQIIVETPGGYKYANRNQLAYFVAKEVNFLYNENGDEASLRYIIRCACFGINADILMFISYITDNTRILQLFLEMTHELTSDWDEFNFTNNLPGFLKLDHDEVGESSDDEIDEEDYKQREVRNEQEVCEKLQVVDIYDYKEEDAETFINQLIRALSLLMIIAKCLPSFEHNMNAKMRKSFVQEIYTLPNRIYHVWAKETDKDYSELINYLKEQAQIEYREQVLANEIEIKFQLVAMGLLLDIYNLAVTYATKDNSFNLLDAFERAENGTYQIQHLMMLEKQKKAEQFVEEAVSLMDDQKEMLPKLLVKNIAKHAMVYMKALDFKMRDRLKGTFFKKGKEQRSLLIERRKSSNRIE